MRAIALGAAGAVWLAAAGGGALGQVYERGQREPVAGEIAGLSAEGVLLKVPEATGAGAGGTLLVSWDVIREVKSETPLKPDPRAFAALADAVWRGRTRVERGDWSMAEAALEPAYLVNRGLSGPTGAALAEGVYRVRLARLWQTGAVWPAMDWAYAVRSAPAGRAGWHGAKFAMERVFDETARVPVALPPIFRPSVAVAALADSGEWKRYESLPGGEGAVGAGALAVRSIARLYRAAARFESGLTLEVAELTPASGDEGAALVADVVLSRVGDAELRAAARARLQARLDAQAGLSDGREWIEAWCHAAMGRSLVRESDTAARREGLVHLLNLPARFGDELPGLAALCLAEAADSLATAGDAAGAKSLRKDLNEHFPWYGGEGVDEPPAPVSQSPSMTTPPATPAPEASPPGKG